ncbi:selection and upkeep of intraepithelial T-cells protein 9-like isoform X2 [Arvicola amphibius]|nr:selection and upkeep of intraepithelial T-cells protein 9-like isoform X2 [Arvicola amphibius]XP_038188578.1 selection and upkeep of intraepithelial T-cells protein 9-like isoform X2 [Arvicola amphibius]XP_038188579.1 selection and upkeep of intraepithelial T-cells protein 9-like isoform X2 [Arvicola amphibius]XP_041911154.1 selection and upkeep of intraepithelial T-cells protein 9-like isoform X2 [Arvicola amphibius]XP_041911155.1 selection and upkeep of intraepithelial T-cells protein 9-li
MEPAASCLLGFLVAFLLLQFTIPTQAMSSDIQISIQVPDAESVLVECTSGNLIPPAEIIWRDSKGNVIPPSSKFDSQNRAGLWHLKSNILLKNRTQGPITCSVYNVTTNQEKKRSIFLPDVLFKPAYMSLMSKRPPRPVIYLIIIFILHCLRCFCCLIWKKYKCIKDSKGLRLVYQLVCEGLPLALYIGFLPLYLTFRSQASILDDAYPLYSNWLWDVCIILVVMMIFFTVLILLLLCTLKTKEQNNQDRLSQTSDEAVQEMASFLSLRSFREEIILHQGSCSEESIPHQGSCSEENIQEQGSCIGKIILHQGSCSEESILHQGSCSEESIQEQGSCIEESILHQGSCSEESIVHQGSCSEERILD